MGDQINFKKTASPQYIAYNQSSTITYSLYNLTTVSIISATIYEPLLAMPTLLFTASNNCELDLANSQITIKLPEKGLLKNQNISCSIQVHTTSTTRPSDKLYSTIATVTAVINNTPVTTIREDATAKLLLNSAYVTVYNSISYLPKYAPGDTVIYTIELMNSGNQTATIKAGHFIDYWKPYRLSNIIVSDSRMLASETQIINTSNLNIPKNTSILFTVTATLI